MRPCLRARVTSLGIYLYVALDLPVRPGLSDRVPSMTITITDPRVR